MNITSNQISTGNRRVENMISAASRKTKQNKKPSTLSFVIFGIDAGKSHATVYFVVVFWCMYVYYCRIYVNVTIFLLPAYF